MKYQIGQKIKVKLKLKVDKMYGSLIFLKEMKPLCGKMLTIINFFEGTGLYIFKETGFFLSEEMLFPPNYRKKKV